jgi:hypothetical protein
MMNIVWNPIAYEVEERSISGGQLELLTAEETESYRGCG